MDIKPKTRGFQVKQASAELVDTPKKEDVALFLHTSGTTSRPKVWFGCLYLQDLSVGFTALLACSCTTLSIREQYCFMLSIPAQGECMCWSECLALHDQCICEDFQMQMLRSLVAKFAHLRCMLLPEGESCSIPDCSFLLGYASDVFVMGLLPYKCCGVGCAIESRQPGCQLGKHHCHI